MLSEIFKEAWIALGRNRVRSLLTMTGISWGIVAVTLLLSYGAGFRSVLLYTFEVFGKAAVICWPGCSKDCSLEGVGCTCITTVPTSSITN